MRNSLSDADDDPGGQARSGSGSPLLSMRGIDKAFPGVRALKNVSFELRPGEIHALVGENGAGKSTLIKVLTGVHQADAGEVRLYDAPARFRSPLEARRAGIATIYQEFALVPGLAVHANVFLGAEVARAGFVDTERERVACCTIFDRLGLVLDPDLPVARLTIAQQQMVEIARALAQDVKILVMDEPTAAIPPRETARLFSILRELAARGIGVIFVTHRIDEIFAVSDRVTVMRNGETVTTQVASSLTRRVLIELMVGRSIEQEFPVRQPAAASVGLEVAGLRGGRIREVSFEARRGEVLGISGLMGAGRTEVARMIFGADPIDAGEIRLDGRQLRITSPRDAIRNGICLLTEDRKNQGLVLNASVKHNFALPNLSRWSRWTWIDRQKESLRFLKYVESLHIRITDDDQPAETLSGGNQQKLLVARWLEADAQVVILDEPTRGIDVGAKYDMYLLINGLAASGKVVVMISSELPELMGMCDRIVVMRDGRVSGEIGDVRSAGQEDIMALSV